LQIHYVEYAQTLIRKKISAQIRVADQRVDPRFIMEQILLPTKVELAKEKGHAYVLTVEPCHPGYANTLGNALRRVMLSSLPGAAVTDVKIKGADHEFTAVPNVKEDILDIVLNLKQLRLKLHSDEPVKLKLHVKGEKNVKASDFEKNAQVEIANPDLHIATLTDDKAELDMEIIVRNGRGASPSEERDKKDREIGMIALDAVFSPVKIVGYNIEYVRVGQRTDYEKLVLNFETDGSITPDDAVRGATQLLMDHLNVVLGVAKAARTRVATDEKEEAVGEEAGAVESKKKRGRPKRK